jgi:hypothetical protein
VATPPFSLPLPLTPIYLQYSICPIEQLKRSPSEMSSLKIKRKQLVV